MASDATVSKTVVYGSEMSDTGGNQTPEVGQQLPDAPKVRPRLPKRPISVDADTLSNAIISVVNAFQAGPLAKKGKIYTSVFDVNEEKIKELNARATDILNDKNIGWFPGSEIEFRAAVGMPDLTRREFSNFDSFISQGGDKAKLERLELSWSRRVSEPFAAQVLVEVGFITERKLDVQELGLFDYHTSHMSLVVAGHFDGLVERVFSLFDPILIASKISLFYAPLIIFRNKLLVQILSNSLSIGSMLVVQVKLIQYLNTSGNIDKKKIIDGIVANHDIGQKIEIIAKQLITPEDSPWWYLIVALGGGGIAFATVLAACMVGFPLLVPRSLIHIGLLKTFNERYQNVYKLVVVTILFGMVIVPIVKKIIEALVQG